MNVEHKKYLKYIILFISVTLTSILTLNFLIDPLWYFGGNKLFHLNYSFNERFSKVNQFLENSTDYDCILLGSSRVTLLNANSITGYNCFNFSFSDGNPEEFIAYSKYITKFGNKPKLTILGIDARFYSRKKHKVIVPEFVNSLERPPLVLKMYLSFNSIKFSLRTLLHKPPQHRFYNEKLIGEILPGTLDYLPPDCFTLEGFGLPYTTDNIKYIDSIKNILNMDIFVGYVAPISAWDMLPLIEDGELASYITVMYELSKKFDRFYDFSVPSDLTKRTDNNYDGHHFSRQSNDEIATILNQGSVKYGLALHQMSFSEYERTFTTLVKNFAKTVQNQKKSSWNCEHRSAVR